MRDADAVGLSNLEPPSIDDASRGEQKMTMALAADDIGDAQGADDDDDGGGESMKRWATMQAMTKSVTLRMTTTTMAASRWETLQTMPAACVNRSRPTPA